MAKEIETPAKKRVIAPNRLTITFGTKYATIHGAIIQDAMGDDREPGEYLVRWLAANYKAKE